MVLWPAQLLSFGAFERCCDLPFGVFLFLRPSEEGRQVHCRGIVVKTVSKVSSGLGGVLMAVFDAALTLDALYCSCERAFQLSQKQDCATNSRSNSNRDFAQACIERRQIRVARCRSVKMLVSP